MNTLTVCYKPLFNLTVGYSILFLFIERHKWPIHKKEIYLQLISSTNPHRFHKAALHFLLPSPVVFSPVVASETRSRPIILGGGLGPCSVHAPHAATSAVQRPARMVRQYTRSLTRSPTGSLLLTTKQQQDQPTAVRSVGATLFCAM